MKIELQATRIEGIADLHGHVDGVLADAEIQVVRKQRVELQAEQAALGQQRAVLFGNGGEISRHVVLCKDCGLAEQRADLRAADVEHVAQLGQLRQGDVTLRTHQTVAEARAVEEERQIECLAHGGNALQLVFRVKRAVFGRMGDIDHAWKYGAPFDGMPVDQFSARWTGVYKADKDGTVKFQLAGDDGYRLFVNDKLITGDWGNHSFSTRSAFMQVSAGEIYRLRIEYFDNVGEATVSFQAGMMDEERLASSLKHARNVIVCAGFNSSTEGEGFDRPFALSYGQEYLINKVASLHDNVNAGGGIDFRNWGQSVQAILMAWYPGQEGGKALAEIITGKLSPSGKLPVSIEEKWEDNPVYGNYYDNRNVPHKRVQYAEGVFVGYRGYDRNGKQPLYPFGYGLSYSSFEYSNLSVEKTGGSRVTVSFDIKNTGKMDAAEAAQVYVRDVECSVPRPLKELKGYDKVYLKKGETKRVRILLDEEAFAYYDVESHRFVVEKGTFEILAGPSSADLPLKATVVL